MAESLKTIFLRKMFLGDFENGNMSAIKAEQSRTDHYGC